MNHSDSNLSAIFAKIPQPYLQTHFDHIYFAEQLADLLNISSTQTSIVPKNISQKSSENSSVSSKTSIPPINSSSPQKFHGNPFTSDPSTSDELDNTNPFKDSNSDQHDTRTIIHPQPIISDKLTIQKINNQRLKFIKLANQTQMHVRTEVQLRHADFIQELDNITKLTTNLAESSKICEKTRQNIKKSAQQIAHPLFNLTDAHHSREKLQTVNSYLKVIKHLKFQLSKLDAFIENGELLKATESYCILYKDTFKFKKYEKFIALQVEISKRLDSASLLIDKKLNKELEKIAKLVFDSKKYRETLECYSKLNKTGNVAEIILIQIVVKLKIRKRTIALFLLLL